MYSTCIFCNAALGTNEVLEHFPVGRRIAYDEATGRLWVVCRGCERWNLTPLETRWEAIEDAERVFRATPLKVSGENIALAQTTEGLELVRIGKPPKTELIAWRYGDQFGRRYRRHVTTGVGIGVVSTSLAAASLVTSTAPLVFAIITAAGLGLNARATIRTIIRLRSKKRILLPDPRGGFLHLVSANANSAALIPHPTEGWQLEVRHRVQFGKPGKGAVSDELGSTILSGESALQALSRLLPHLNQEGGSKRNVRDATATIQDMPSLDALLRAASTNTEARKTHFRVPDDRSILGILPAHMRLALEMALHDEDERRAMEGELFALEERWKEADAIARIADSLTLPEAVEQELARIRAAEGHPRG